MKRMNRKGIFLVVLIVAMACIGFAPRDAKAADFNPSVLISDVNFIAINSMDTAAVQRFLVSKNSYLKDFSENGRSAAQIIYDAARGRYEAAGSISGITIDEGTGTVSAGVLLATLQKEQSLISKTSRDDNALSKAMGYACPDAGGCNPNYTGFTKQVENAAWQFRYNYERALGRGFADYQVGQSFNFDGDTGTFSNRSTASLYRYTPHVYNGNYNFWNLFYNTYKFQVPDYSAVWVTQSSYPTLNVGDSATMTITYRNTGSATWTRGVVNLGLVDQNYGFRPSYALPIGWPTSDRPAILNEASVAPGATGSFTFTVGNSGLPAGNYRLDVGLVADGIAWFGHETHAYWDVNVLPSPPRYSASWVGQSSYPVLVDGATATMTITYRNTGSATWTKGVVNLGTVFQDYRWRTDRYALGVNWPTGNRPAVLNESSVTPGQTGTFTFVIENNGLASFNYRLDVGLVADGIAWFGPETHAYWDVNIMPRYSASWVGQSGYPVLNNGDSSTMTITYRNTGSATWTKGVVNLGLIDQNYRFLSSYPMASGWPTSDRPAILNEASVVPGATGSFTFTVANSGLSTNNYRLDVGLVADGIAWFPAATHAYWDVYAR